MTFQRVWRDDQLLGGESVRDATLERCRDAASVRLLTAERRLLISVRLNRTLLPSGLLMVLASQWCWPLNDAGLSMVLASQWCWPLSGAGRNMSILCKHATSIIRRQTIDGHNFQKPYTPWNMRPGPSLDPQQLIPKICDGFGSFVSTCPPNLNFSGW